jgi:uncharacterized protein
MELWAGTLADFTTAAYRGSIADSLSEAFFRQHNVHPAASELRSWEHSLHALASVAPRRNSAGIGVVVEFHLPYSGQRIDVLMCGESSTGRLTTNVIELKQWSTASLEDEFALNVLVDGVEHVHPSQQALDYADFLAGVHDAFSDGAIPLAPCSFCHNLPRADAVSLRDPRFADLLSESPLFDADQLDVFGDHIIKTVGGGDGLEFHRRIRNGRFKPSPKVIETVAAVVEGDERWRLLENQRKAYNAIWACLQRLSRKEISSAVLVRGAPGTGKSVIAVQLLADALKAGFSAAHSTGGKAFTTTLRSQFKGAHHVFIWNMSTRNAVYKGLDLLLVDEAHRVRESSDTRYTPKGQRNKKAQVDELLDAAKVTVFFLDENQFVRPDEEGESRLIREATGRKRIPLREYDLATQFRCGGCLEYLHWVDWVLDFRRERPAPWRNRYRFDIAGSAEDLEILLDEAAAGGESARLVAGFCWKWSEPLSDGTLVDDVQIEHWSRPWNRKRDPKKQYRPENDPYTLWATTDAGREEVGCIYSAQGFEFDRVGVIWGSDLVWRSGVWVAQPKCSFDAPVKRSSRMLDLVRNAYRVLLTRGMKETRVLCLDTETREHLVACLSAV